MRTTDEIENERVEALKKINETRENLNVLEEEKHRLELELMKVKEGIRLARKVIATKKTQAEILQSEYWRAKS